MNKSTKSLLKFIESRLRPDEFFEDIWLVVVDAKTWSGWEFTAPHIEKTRIMREEGESDDALRERVEAYLDAHRRRKWPFIVSMLDVVQHNPSDVRITRGGVPDEH